MNDRQRSPGRTRQPLWILVFVLALGAGIAALAFLEPAPDFAGRAHPDIEWMRQGGDGAARHSGLLFPGWLFGCGVILCFSSLVHFGALGGQGRRRLGWLLKLATLLYLGTWSWLVWAYAQSLDTVGPDLVLGLPRPTAIMLFVFWPVSMLFNVLFVGGFDRWILTPDEAERFARLVESRRGKRD